MQTIEEAYESAAKLYWIAVFLTGCPDRSAGIVIEEIERSNEREGGPAFSGSTQVRRAVIKRAIASISDELTWSAALMAARQMQHLRLTGMDRFVDQAISQTEMTNALLRIEAFPKCALLLTVFEGFPVDDAAALLRSDRELTISGCIAGLYALTSNLAVLPDLEIGGNCKEKILQLQSDRAFRHLLVKTVTKLARLEILFPGKNIIIRYRSFCSVFSQLLRTVGQARDC